MNRGKIKAHKGITWCYLAPVACFIACIGDLVALVVFDHIYPGYDSHIQPISALGAAGSPIAGLVSCWWIGIGTVFLLFAIAYGKCNSEYEPEHRITAWMIGIYAVGEEIGSGLFPGNHLAGHLTPIGIVHNVIGGIGVVALVAAPFVLMKKYSRKNNFLFNRFLLFISLFGILEFLLFSVSRLTWPQLHGLRMWHGWWQRIFVANYYIFLAGIAIKLLLERKESLYGRSSHLPPQKEDHPGYHQ